MRSTSLREGSQRVREVKEDRTPLQALPCRNSRIYRAQPATSAGSSRSKQFTHRFSIIQTPSRPTREHVSHGWNPHRGNIYGMVEKAIPGSQNNYTAVLPGRRKLWCFSLSLLPVMSRQRQSPSGLFHSQWVKHIFLSDGDEDVDCLRNL